MIYAGIGARKTPQDILKLMNDIGYHLAILGWTLRSGAANGADSAFEVGCDKADGKREIFLPWNGFNDRFHSPQQGVYDWKQCSGWSKCDAITDEFHPSKGKLGKGPRSMMNRNCMQVLGQRVEAKDKSGMIVCWTPKGLGGGGTGEAIRIANHYGVTVKDLGNDKVLQDVLLWLDKLKNKGG